MTGPEHYAEAEQLIGTVEQLSETYGGSFVDARTAQVVAESMSSTIALAQVHATLALAAATALAAPEGEAAVQIAAWGEVGAW